MKLEHTYRFSPGWGAGAKADDSAGNSALRLEAAMKQQDMEAAQQATAQAKKGRQSRGRLGQSATLGSSFEQQALEAAQQATVTSTFSAAMNGV